MSSPLTPSPTSIYQNPVPPASSFLPLKISTPNNPLPLLANPKRRLTLSANSSQRVRTQGQSGRHRSPRRHPLRPKHIHHPLDRLLRIAGLVAMVRRKRRLYLLVEFGVVLDHGAVVFHVWAEDFGSVVSGFEDDGLDAEVCGFDLETFGEGYVECYSVARMMVSKGVVG